MDLARMLDIYRAPLTGLLASWGVSWHDAHELAMDSFAEAWLRRSRCRGNWQDPAVFGAWLRGVARNVHRNWRRAGRRRESRVRPLDLEVRKAEAPEDGRQERHEVVRAAIARLPRKQRQAVLMHYLDETRVADVAVLLGVTEKTVEGRLYRARKALRRLLEETPSRAAIGRMLACL